MIKRGQTRLTKPRIPTAVPHHSRKLGRPFVPGCREELSPGLNSLSSTGYIRKDRFLDGDEVCSKPRACSVDRPRWAAC
jgi:hypothetical protein